MVITPFMEIGLLEAQPIGDDAAALERAAHQQRDRRGAVIGACGAVDAGGGAKFDNQHDSRLAPGRAHVGFDGCKRSSVEGAAIQV